MKKISITTTSFADYDKEPLETLKKRGFNAYINPYKRQLKKEDVLEFCQGSEGIIAGTETLDAEILGKLKTLKVVSRCGTGMDNVDLKEAERLGIRVYNTPDAPTIAVAELTIALMLDVIRKISLMDNDIRKGNWCKRMGNLLSEKKVGIIGFGRIGKKVADFLTHFNCEVKYFDPFVEDGLFGLEKLPFSDLIAWADIVSLHVSTKDKIFGEKELSMMKKSAWLVNISRGTVVDEEALYRSLKNNHLAGAAIDVFSQEPYQGSLKELDNVVLTPHIGSYAKEARIKMEIEAAENLIKGFEDE